MRAWLYTHIVCGNCDCVRSCEPNFSLPPALPPSIIYVFCCLFSATLYLELILFLSTSRGVSSARARSQCDIHSPSNNIVWACQRDIHSPINNVVCRARGCPRGTAPAVVKVERSAVNGNGCPTPEGGWVPLHSNSCRGLYRPSVGRGLRVYRVGGVPCSVSNQPSSTLVVLGHK